MLARSSHTVVDCTAVEVWEVSAIAAICVCYLSSYLFLDEPTAQLVHVTLPYGLAGILLFNALQTARGDTVAIWTPLFWFRISSAIYFCLGTVAHRWMNWYTLSYTNTFYEVTADRVARFNILSSLCILVVLCTAGLAAHVFEPSEDPEPIEFERQILTVTACSCCIVGYAVKYLLLFPLEMGQLGDRQNLVLPATVLSFSLLAPPGLFLMTLLAHRVGGMLHAVAVGLLLLDIVGGTLRFMKVEVLLPLLMFLLAHLYVRLTLARVVTAACAVLFAFVILQPAIEFGRSALERNFGKAQEGTFSDRLSILHQYWTADATPSKADELQGSLGRIAYINPAAAAMDFYDQGHGDDTIGAALWILIPRVFWEDKPVYDVGARFTEQINGTTSSSTWMGYFAEAYYNFGWPGILLLVPVGLVLFAFSRYARFVLTSRRWLHFPAVFLGLTTGILTDNPLIGVVFVSAILAAVVHVLANQATAFLQAYLRASRELRGVAPQNQSSS